MKKLLAFLLAMTMLLCLCACGDDSNNKDKNEDKDKGNQTSASVNKDENAGDATKPTEGETDPIEGSATATTAANTTAPTFVAEEDNPFNDGTLAW